MSITSRIDAITKIPPMYRHAVLPAPKSCKIELTAACNYRCGFCMKSQRPDGGEMDRALYSRLIREMRVAGVDELGVFFIGESFSCKWLPDAIREAKEVGYPYVFLTTNGSLAYPEKVRACMDAGLDSLKFSVNFADDKQFAEVTQVKPSLYRRALSNIKAARQIRDDEGYKCAIYASSIAFDGEQGDRMAAIMAEVAPYCDETYRLPLFGMGGASKAAGMKPQPGNPGRLDNMREPLPCWSVTSAHIDKDGILQACCFGQGMEGSLAMADLKTQPFMTGWNSAAFQTLRKAHLAKDVNGTGCETCVAA